MNLIINTNPKSDEHSVNITLARNLAKAFDGPTEMVRLYGHFQEYFHYEFNQEWIDLVLKAKRIIFPVPMWNLSIPAALKDFLDKIIKKGSLWDMDKNNQFVGLLADKKISAYIIMTSGDFYEEGHHHDFVVPYLKAILILLGVKKIKAFRLGGVHGSRRLVADKEFIAQKTKEMFKAFGLKFIE